MSQALRISINLDNAKQLSEAFDVLKKKGIAIASRDALNGIAFAAKAEWPKQMGKSFTLRNRWTAGSIRVTKARGSNMASMQSEVGSVAPYMATQEHGGTKTAKGKHGVPIPTPIAAGQPAKANRRTRLVQKKNLLSALNLDNAHEGKSPRQRVARAIRKAAQGSGVAFLDFGKKKGIFRVAKGSSRRKHRLKLLWDLSKKTIEQKPKPTLRNTLRAIYPLQGAIMLRALQRQLDLYWRHKGGMSGPVRSVY